MKDIKMTGTAVDIHGYVNTFEVTFTFNSDGWYVIERKFNGKLIHSLRSGPEDLKYNIRHEELFMMGSDYNDSFFVLFYKYLKNKGITK